jgi:hypothetical protein
MLMEDSTKSNKLSHKKEQAKKGSKLTHRLGQDPLKRNEFRKTSNASVNDSSVYRHQDSRHFSQQHKPIFIANLLNGGSNDTKLYEEIRRTQQNQEEDKTPDTKKNNEMDMAKPDLYRSPSEEKSIGNLFTHAPPHGGALEKLNNEERLNFLSDANLSKIDNSSLHRRQEKSVDLDLRSGVPIDRHSSDMITNQVISSNMLSKYLTKFLGNKDYRTTEERELDK